MKKYKHTIRVNQRRAKRYKETFLFLTVSGTGNLVNTVVDGISFKFPPSPPLSQPEDIPSNQYCNRSTLFEHCPGNGVCTCTHKLNIPLNSVVEILLIDECEYTLEQRC